MVTLRCDIHEHMRAIILVLDTPHFVVSDTEGRYRLEGLPPAGYVLRVWLDRGLRSSGRLNWSLEAVLHADFP